MKTIGHKEAVCLVAEGDKVSPEKGRNCKTNVCTNW